jgi:predicted glutamine amidotransferase/acetyl esterase/lipase
MWGMVSTAFPENVVLGQLVTLPDSLKNLGGGPDGPGNVNGWGLIYYTSETLVAARGQPMAYTDTNFNVAAQALASSGMQIGMGHVRNAASGAVNIPDPHPFVRVRGGKTWTLAHNGVLNVANLKNLIGSTYLSQFSPTVGSNWDDPNVVDTDLYLIYIIKCIEASNGDIKAGIAEAETTIYLTDSSSNANFLLSDGTTMWGYKKSVDSLHPLYYKYDASAQYSAIASQPPEGSGLGNWLSMSNFNLVEISAGSPPVLYQDIRSYGIQTGDFSVVVLPDTQFYSESYPAIFSSQTQWIASNKISSNIVFVTHEGDIVNTNSQAYEWQNAASSTSKLDEANIPWGVLPGNHDLTGGSTNYNTYFSYSRFSTQSWYGGAYQNINTNNYELFTVGPDDYLILHLQYQPSAQVLAWANNIIVSHPGIRVIVTTHDYMNTDGSRDSTGDNIWNNLVMPHADQIFLVLCGHNHGENERADVVNGNTVYQLLADYQDRSNGGNGWLRVLQFHPSDDQIIVKTYSPYLGQYESDADSSFTLSYDMTETTVSLESPQDNILTMNNEPDFRFTATSGASTLSCTLWLQVSTSSTPTYYGTISKVASGVSTLITPSSPIPNGQYQWWITCSDGSDTTTSQKYTLTVNVLRGDQSFKSNLDDSTRYYWLDLPDGFDESESTPLVIFLHGYGGSRLSYPQKYPTLRQTFQSNGWIVASVDCRTVNGYQNWYTEPSRRDITDVINAVRGSYNVDPNHIHVMGNSMGGGGALKYAMFNNQLIASLVDIHGVTDFTQFYIDTPTYKASLVAAYGGTPSQLPAVYASESAHGNENSLSHTPVMILHGDADDVVKVSQSRSLAQSLAALGYTVKYIEVPGVAHDASAIIIGRENEIFSWLRDHPLYTPAYSSITITSNPIGSGFITIDGAAITTPKTYNWATGEQHTISASSIVSGTDMQYLFTGWSDGGSQTHGYTVPASPETITASYKTQWQVTFSQIGLNNDAAGTVLTVGASAYTCSQLPQTMWVDDGAYYSYTPTVSSSVVDKQYVSTSITGGLATPIKSAGAATGNYKTQWRITFAANPASAGTVSPMGANLWEDSGILQISATPQNGYSFSTWSSSTGFITFTSAGSASTLATIGGPGIVTASFASSTNTVSVTITSNPSGAGFVVVDGASATTPRTYSWIAGSTHTLQVNSPVGGGSGIRYVYTGWSDGGGQTHSYTVPSTTSTVTANLKTQYQLSLSSARGSPAGAGWYDSGVSASFSVNTPVSGSSGTRYVCTGYSGSASGTGAAGAVAMSGPKTITFSWKTQYMLTVYISPSSLSATKIGVSPTSTPTSNGRGSVYYWIDSSTTVALTAKTISGYRFRRWSGAATGTSATTTLKMTAPKTIIATYTR